MVQASSVLSLNLEEFLWLPKGFLGLSSPTESVTCRTNECSGPGLYTAGRKDETPSPQPPWITNHGRNSPPGSIPVALWIQSFQSRPFLQRCFVPRSNQETPGMQAIWATYLYKIQSQVYTRPLAGMCVCMMQRQAGRSQKADPVSTRSPQGFLSCYFQTCCPVGVIL